MAAKDRHELIREIAKVNFHGTLTMDYFERIIDTVLASEFTLRAMGARHVVTVMGDNLYDYRGNAMYGPTYVLPKKGR